MVSAMAGSMRWRTSPGSPLRQVMQKPVLGLRSRSCVSGSMWTRFLVAAVGEVPEGAADGDGVAAEGAVVGVEGAAHAVGGGVELVDAVDAEAPAEGLPDVGAHAVAPGHGGAVLFVERGGRGVDEVAAEFADVLDDVAFGGAHFGPEGLVAKFAGEADGTAGADGGGEAEAVGGAVVEGEARVHLVAGFESEVVVDDLGEVEFAAAGEDGAFGHAGGAGGVDERGERRGVDLGASCSWEGCCVCEGGNEGWVVVDHLDIGG